MILTESIPYYSQQIWMDLAEGKNMTIALRYQSDKEKVEVFVIISTLCLSTSHVYSLCTEANCLNVEWGEMWKEWKKKGEK